MNDRGPPQQGEGPLAIVCGGGSLPLAVADLVAARGRRVVLFPLQGFADAAAVARYPHHWLRLGETARLRRVAQAEGCRDLVLIGAVVRPRLSQLRLDWLTVRYLPRFVRLFRGGDDHLLKGLAGIGEDIGFRLLGAHEVAPEILAGAGKLGQRAPSARDRADIARGLAVLAATGPFDIGQAVVVADNRVLALEAAEGTDRMLDHIAVLRREGRLGLPDKVGVLVKAPKPGQDTRLDLPSIGPKTVEGVIRAGLAGLAVQAGCTVVAEPQTVVARADEGGVFVAGVHADAGSP
jgi:DUF1009 family protein